MNGIVDERIMQAQESESVGRKGQKVLFQSYSFSSRLVVWYFLCRT